MISFGVRIARKNVPLKKVESPAYLEGLETAVDGIYDEL